MKTFELYDKIDKKVIHTEEVEEDRITSAYNRYRRGAVLRNEKAGEDRFQMRLKPEQPYPSWTYKSGEWVAPKKKPTTGGTWDWDEEAQEWVEVNQEPAE